jgi:ubiquinone/menaquinone biosynthesis C-methylase UbiE
MNNENRIAVLIGNCTYPHFREEDLPSLVTPLNDVQGLQRTLLNPARGRFKTAECIPDAESQEIRDKIEGVIKAASNPDTLGLIFYSGHGLLDSDDRLHLTAKDSKPETWNRTIPIADIAKWIRLHSPQQLVILLDCCYSGAGLRDMEVKGASATSKLKDAVSENLLQLKAKGVVMITATTPIQQARGDKSKGLGIFTRHVLDGLDTVSARRGKKQTVTVRDLYNYVSRKMEMEQGRPQTPMIWGAETGGELVMSEATLLGRNSKPVATTMGWYQVSQDILDHVSPAYILDRKFHFLDWNTSFECFIAQPLGLRRQEHVGTFLDKLQNCEEVEKRSFGKFTANSVPSVDIEVLEFGSQDYGLIVFHKIATQIIGQNGRLRSWCVNLNVTSVQKSAKFWKKMNDNLQRELNWSKYAVRYDSIIADFPEHQRLVELVVSKIGEPERCLDLGSGTGSVTFSVVRKCPNTAVLAIEKNGTMVDCMRKKIDLIPDPEIKRRITLYKGDITSRLRQEKDQSFDACVMLNVLFALDDPAEVMTEIFRVLRPNGVVALSTSHKRTDINRLFAEIEKSLKHRRLWNEQVAESCADAFERNVEMNALITRDSIEDIKKYVRNAGFKILEFEDGHYVDCVVVLKAVKPEGKKRKPSAQLSVEVTPN